MQFLVVFKPTPDITREMLEPVLPEETMEAWSLIKGDVVRSIWYLAPDPAWSETSGPGGNVIFMECADETEMQRIVDGLPLVVRGLVSAEVMRLVPFDGFDLLMTDAPAATRR